MLMNQSVRTQASKCDSVAVLLPPPILLTLRSEKRFQEKYDSLPFIIQQLHLRWCHFLLELLPISLIRLLHLQENLDSALYFFACTLRKSWAAIRCNSLNNFP